MAATKAPYASLVGGNAKFAGIDQGIDFTGSGPVYALDAGTITRKVDSGSGWPGTGAVIVEKLSAGPAAGKSVYFAEDLTAAQGIAVGQTVQKGQQIAYATGSGLAPGIEVGWATDAGLPLAPRPAARPASQFTPQGADFLHFVSGQGVFSPSGGIVAGTGGPSANAEAASTLAGGAKHIPGVQQAVDIGSFLGKLSDPKVLQRGGEMVAGSVLLLLALGLIGFSAVSRAAVPVQPAARAARSGVRAARSQTPGNRRARRTAARSPYKSSRQGGSEPRTRPGFEGVGRTPKKAAKRPARRGEGIPF